MAEKNLLLLLPELSHLVRRITAKWKKEALSLAFGVKKFHQYHYGHKFTLITDHKPLLAILGPKKGIPPLAAARL